MSKPIKNLITESYRKRFADVDGGVVIDIRGVEANDNNRLRGSLSEDGIRVTVVKNSLARTAFNGTALENINEVLEGPSAIVYGADSPVVVARKLMDIAKEIKTIEFKGALMDGQIFQADQVEALSKYPTREEAQAQVVQVLLGPASQISGILSGAGGQIASILETIIEKGE